MAMFDPTQINQLRAAWLGDVDRKMGELAGGLRRQMAEHSAKASQQLHDLATIAQSLQVAGTGDSPGVSRIENIPGWRQPYDYIVDIPIGNSETSIQQQSFTVTQDGPFVAISRYCTFQSALEFSLDVDGSEARFSGRSFGRYRPIHSAWDLQDAQGGGVVSLALPLPGNLSVVGYPDLTSSQSGFRTMEFDGRIEVVDSGSGRPRQNFSVPSVFWTKQINSPFDLGALDFFERGSVVTFKVQPNHVNNPPAGNAIGDFIFGSAGWPFGAGQYDKHEGIVTPGAFSTNNATPPATTRLTTDLITRLPDGILTLGFSGFRIIQPTGPMG